MDPSVTFARHFARLLWLLLNEPQNIAEQKSALRALVAVSREGPVALRPAPAGVTANGIGVAVAISGIPETAARLATHGASELYVHLGATPADLLNAARLLASDPDAGTRSYERLRNGGATTVELVPLPSGPSPRAALDGFEIVSDEVLAKAVGGGTRRASSVGITAPVGTGRASGAIDGSLFSQFAAAPSAERHDALLAELDAVSDAAALPVLDRIALAAEQAQRDGNALVLTPLIAGVIRRADRADPETRRDFAMAMRRMVSPHALRLIAAQLPRRVVPRTDVELVLSRTSEEGADAVIELLTQSQSATDRRAYYDMLLTLRAGIPALIHMLGDARWYVVRNAVDLLGEMQVGKAERAITGLLKHGDERVRASAGAALLRLDTPAARLAVHSALASTSATVRLQAIAAIAARKSPKAAETLIRALDAEQDEAVQRSVYAALGKVATPDAVARLVASAEPATGLFKRKSPALRAAAVLALGEAATPEALTALRTLIKDNDATVREAAHRAMIVARGGTLGVTDVFARQA